MSQYEIRVNGVVRASVPSEDGDQVEVTHTDESGGRVTQFPNLEHPRPRPEVALNITRGQEQVESPVSPTIEPETEVTREDKTVAELRAEAVARGIELPSKATKAAIIEALEAADATAAAPETPPEDEN